MKVSTRDVVIVSLAAALSTALSFLRLFELPQGGSVTLELLPVFYIAFLRGTRYGIAAGFISGIIQLILRPFIVHPVQVLFDYPLPMAAAGIAGLFRSIEDERPVRAAMAVAGGFALILIAGFTWIQIDRISSSPVMLEREGTWTVSVDFAPDTTLGDVEARMLTAHELPGGVQDTLSVLTAHGEKARLWLDQAGRRMLEEYTKLFGNVLVMLLAVLGTAAIVRFLSVGTVPLGVLVGSVPVLFFHTLAGVIFFAEYAPAGQNVWIYSTIYNASYVVPQVILSMLILPPLLRRSRTTAP